MSVIGAGDIYCYIRIRTYSYSMRNDNQKEKSMEPLQVVSKLERYESI